MSADYLLKTEPSEYSFENLQRDGATVWDGVSNPTAVKNLREMTPGTRLIIYETGDRKSAVGTATGREGGSEWLNGSIKFIASSPYMM